MRGREEERRKDWEGIGEERMIDQIVGMGGWKKRRTEEDRRGIEEECGRGEEVGKIGREDRLDRSEEEKE